MSSGALSIRGLELRRGSRPVLRGVDIDVAAGEVVALMGASGSGKTTILRCVAGLERFHGGTVRIDDLELPAGPTSARVTRALRHKVGFVFQFHCLFEHLTVIENVCLAPIHAHRVPRAAAEARAREFLRVLGVEHRAHALPRELSGGEAQRVAIARTLAVDPPIVLMDEPTASLDRSRRAELAALLNTLVSHNRTLVIATHDEEFARMTSGRRVSLADGAVCATLEAWPAPRNPNPFP